MVTSIDERVQLLANCKFLYGPGTEICTLSSSSCYQAVAMSFEPLTVSWTKFRHSSATTSRYQAILSLLNETETEIANLFSANGVNMPLSGDSVQTIILHSRLQGPPSGATSSARSEDAGFEFIATTESSSPEILCQTSDIVFEVSPKVEEKAPEPEAYKKMEEDNFGYSFGTANKKDKKKKKGVLFEEVDEVTPADLIVEEPAEDEWGGWGQPKPKKKGGKKADAEPEQVSEAVVEEPKDDPWSFGSSKKDKKKGKKVKAEPEPEPEPIVEEKPADDPWSFGSVKKDKKKGKKVVESEPEPVVEEEQPADDPWSFSSTKKGKKVIEPEPEPEPELVLEEPKEDAWSFGTSRKDSKKGKKGAVEPEFKLVPEAKVEDDPCSFREIDDPQTIPEREPAKDKEPKDDQWSFWLTTKDKKGQSESETPESHLVADEEKFPEPGPLVVEDQSHPNPEKVALENNQGRNDREMSYKRLVTEDSSPPEEPLGKTAHTTSTHRTQPLAGQTVVLKIIHATNSGNQTLEIMVTLTDNTRTAIFDAVNLHLDSRNPVGHITSQRKIEIKYGAGKNGDLDLSALAESKWPEYLEYFCQYTKLPELTVDVVDYY